MIKIKLLFLLFILLSGSIFSQSNKDSIQKSDYLSFQTGFIYDGYNSLGIRVLFEYQKDLKGNWQYGISYENSRHFGNIVTDKPYDRRSNLNLLSLNGYYKLNLIENRLFWTVGMGVGALHVNWDDNDSFGLTINASMTLNLRVSKRIYIETSPLIVYPPVNRLYFSPMNTDHYSVFYAFTIFPIGIKVKL